MTKYYTILLIYLLMMGGCTKDPDPVPPIDSNYSYFNLYNFLVEPYDVSWEIDGDVVVSNQLYGSPNLEFRAMEKDSLEMTINAKESGAERIIDGLTRQVEQFQYYLVSIMGNEADPTILCEPMELKKPSLGSVKLRIMHATMELGPLDLYIGGTTPDHKALSNIKFAQLTEYMEASQENLWQAIIITPYNRTPEDSTLMSYTANNAFLPNHIYMGVLGHTTSSSNSSLNLQLYDQPVN